MMRADVSPCMPATPTQPQMYKEVPLPVPWKTLMLRHGDLKQRMYYLPPRWGLVLRVAMLAPLAGGPAVRGEVWPLAGGTGAHGSLACSCTCQTC